MNRIFNSWQKGRGRLLVWTDVSPGQSRLTGLNDPKAMPTPVLDTQPKGWMWITASEVTVLPCCLVPITNLCFICVSDHLGLYFVHLITNTTGQWPSDIKQFSAMSSLLSHRKTKGTMKEGGKKKDRKKHPVKISFNKKAQYQIIFPEAMTAKYEKSESWTANEEFCSQKTPCLTPYHCFSCGIPAC